MEKTCSRRTFLKKSAMGTIGTAFCMGAVSGCALMDEVNAVGKGVFGIESGVVKGVTPITEITSDILSRVSVVSGKNVVNDSGSINPKKVQEMFDKAILEFTGKHSIEAAWYDIIPELKSTDTIGLKINCINPSLPSSPEMVSAIIDHLLKLGLHANNIMVWDRSDTSIMGLGSLSKSGYTPNSSDKGVKYISTATDNIGYDDTARMKVPSQNLDFSVSRILSKECRYLINVPQLRSHIRAGMTNCLKNYYGVIPLFDKMTVSAANKMHHKNCNPVIPELYDNPIVKEKTVLHVSDALMTVYQGGPWGNPQCIPGKILVGKDPVAIDYLGLKILEEERLKRNISSLMSHAKYIQTAAEMGLGTNNLKQMTVRTAMV